MAIPDVPDHCSHGHFFWIALISSITVSIVSAIFSVHCHWVVTFNEIWFPATALEEAFKFFMRKTGEDGRVADFVSVQVKNWKNSTVCDRVQEFVGLPGSSQRTSLSFTITDNNSSDKIRVVQYSTESRERLNIQVLHPH